MANAKTSQRNGGRKKLEKKGIHSRHPRRKSSAESANQFGKAVTVRTPPVKRTDTTINSVYVT